MAGRYARNRPMCKEENDVAVHEPEVTPVQVRGGVGEVRVGLASGFTASIAWGNEAWLPSTSPPSRNRAAQPPKPQGESANPTGPSEDN